jgi:hypothetical protein
MAVDRAVEDGSIAREDRESVDIIKKSVPQVIICTS